MFVETNYLNKVWILGIDENGITKQEITRHEIIPMNERNVVFSSFSNSPTSFECTFREQEHLKCENLNEMKWKVLVACKSAVYENELTP